MNALIRCALTSRLHVQGSKSKSVRLNILASTNTKNPNSPCKSFTRNILAAKELCTKQTDNWSECSIHRTNIYDRLYISSKFYSSSSTRLGIKKSDPNSKKKTKSKDTSAIDDTNSKKKTKGKDASAIDKLLEELSDDEEDEEDLEPSEHQGARTPTAIFLEGLHKIGSKKGKSKSGKGSSSGGHPLHVDYQDAKAVVDIDLYWNELEKVINDQRNFFVQHITVRSANALDDLEIDLEGDKFPLKEVAAISKRDPKRLVIDSSTFPQATVSIMQILRSSALNLNPQQEGTRIYVAIPKVTRETRENLVKSAKIKLNETKDELKNVQNLYLKKVDSLEASGTSSIPKDNFAAVKGIIMSIEQNFVQIAEADTQKKQNDLLNKN